MAPAARSRVTEWHPRLRLPVKITVAGKKTDLSYDSAGRLLRRAEIDTATFQSRVTRYRYYSAADFGGALDDARTGLLKSIYGPRADVRDLTTYAYDAHGNRTETTSALGHVSRVLAHDAHGRALMMRDANGALTEFGYDPRGRLLSLTVAGHTTRFAYDWAGRLLKTMRADGAQWRYEYDGAGRLLAVADGLGRRIEYTLDSRGNRLREAIKDAAGRVTRSLRRVYNRHNRLMKTRDGAGQTRLYEYDASGNLTLLVEDPAGMNRRTRQAFDAHNRLSSRIDAAGGKTAYAYDALNRLAEVNGAGLDLYTYDALGNRQSKATAERLERYRYDPESGRLRQREPGGAYDYDAGGRRTVTMRWASGSRSSARV